MGRNRPKWTTVKWLKRQVRPLGISAPEPKITGRMLRVDMLHYQATDKHQMVNSYKPSVELGSIVHQLKNALRSVLVQKACKRKQMKNFCSSCNGYRICLTCNGTGLWYEGSFNEERCGSCRGSGICPACFGIANPKNWRSVFIATRD